MKELCYIMIPDEENEGEERELVLKLLYIGVSYDVMQNGEKMVYPQKTLFFCINTENNEVIPIDPLFKTIRFYPMSEKAKV